MVDPDYKAIARLARKISDVAIDSGVSTSASVVMSGESAVRFKSFLDAAC